MPNAQGRFTSPDPDNSGSIKSDPQICNVHGYVSNPLRFTDELGLNCLVCDTNRKNCADLTDSQYNDYLKSISNIYQTGTTEVKGATGTVILSGKLFGVAGAEKVITAIAK